MLRCSHSTSVDGGFTLFEMLLVLAILALIAFFSLPLLYRPADRLDMRATAYDMVNQLRAARSAAIRSNQPRAMTVDIDTRRYWVSGVTKRKQIADSISVVFVTLQKERVSSSQARLQFHPDGSATGGAIILSQNAQRAVVRIDWMTGHAELIWKN